MVHGYFYRDHCCYWLGGVWTGLSTVFPLYADTENAIAEEQRNDDPNDSAHFLSRYDDMRLIEKAHHCEGNESKPEQIKSYWEDESQVIAGIPTFHPKSNSRFRNN